VEKLSEDERKAAAEFLAGTAKRESFVAVVGPISAGAIFMGAASICVVWPRLWIPCVAGAASLAVVLAVWLWITLRRCPKCGHLYSKKKMRLVHTEEGAYQSAGEYGVYSVDFTNSLYRTKCDRCGEGIWIRTSKIG
jgi:ribosomal protein S27AE